MLLAADLVALLLAFLLGATLTGSDLSGAQLVLFLASLPGWVLAAKIYGLYDNDDKHVYHSTTDELSKLFHLVTVGTWLLFVAVWLAGVDGFDTARLVASWCLAAALVVLGRGLARSLARQSVTYLQNTIIVGAGDIGQLVARKLLQHPEYRINVVGFVDAHPKRRREGLDHISLLGPPENLPELVRLLDVERVVVAFSNEDEQATVDLIRSLQDLDVQVDLVPRLFDVVGPNAAFDTVEGFPLVGLPPMRLSPSSRLVKRLVDIAGATVGLVITSPLVLAIAIFIRRDSPGPIFFRQERLGYEMKPFTALKFRTMRVGADTAAHRAYIEQTMSNDVAPGANGLYKLERNDEITRVGRFLRSTSLDELPQLINVLRGDMSLVGPRPCLEYEMQFFQPHHFERFRVPAGLTGLWQVTARAKSTFGEALDMDVAYARAWSLGLDLRLLVRTPIQLLAARGTA